MLVKLIETQLNLFCLVIELNRIESQIMQDNSNYLNKQDLSGSLRRWLQQLNLDCSTGIAAVWHCIDGATVANFSGLSLAPEWDCIDFATVAHLSGLSLVPDLDCSASTVV